MSKETQQHDPKLIVHAESMSARQKGDNDLAAILKEVNRSTSRPSKIRKMFFTSKKEPVAYTAEEALEFIFKNNLSKQQYLNMRNGAKFRNCNIYPSYEEILQCKYKCRVQELSVSDTIAKVPLQNLLDQTTRQIVSLQQEVILCAIKPANDNKFICEIIFIPSGHRNVQKTFISRFYVTCFLDVIPIYMKLRNHIFFGRAVNVPDKLTLNMFWSFIGRS